MKGNIILVVGGENFHVEKEKLSLSSDYFRAMFSRQFQEEQREKVELKSVELEPFRTLIQWIQSDVTEVEMETVTTNELMDILETSNMLQFNRFRSECSRILCSRVDPDNCWQLLQLADLVSDDQLFRVTHQFSLRRFHRIFQQSHLSHLDLNNFIKVTSSQYLNVGDERSVLEAITAWIEVNKPDSSVIRNIFQTCLYFNELSKEDQEDVKKNKYFIESTCDAESLMSKPRRRRLPTVPCVVGHVFGKNNSKSVSIFSWSEAEKKVVVLCHIPSVQADQVVASGFKVSTDGEELVLSGGEFSLGYSKTRSV